MSHLPNRRSFAALVAASVVGAFMAGTVGNADNKRKRLRDIHDEAREALEKGEIMPLQAVMDATLKQFPGDVVGIELERHKGALAYELKIVRPNRVRIEVYVDAKTGAVLKVEEK